MITALHNTRIVSDGKITEGKAVLIDGKTIKAIVNESEMPANAQKVDLQGNYIAPGFLDLQLYGSGGRLLSIDTDEATLLQMETDLLAQGTIGFFPTISTNTDEVIEQTIRVGKSYREKRKGNFLGLHLEGPFLNPVRKGAHNQDFIKKASLELVRKWVDMADGVI